MERRPCAAQGGVPVFAPQSVTPCAVYRVPIDVLDGAELMWTRACMQATARPANPCLATLSTLQPRSTTRPPPPAQYAAAARLLQPPQQTAASAAASMQHLAAASIAALTTPAAAVALPGIQAPLRAALSGGGRMHALQAALASVLPATVGSARAVIAVRPSASAAAATVAQHEVAMADKIAQLAALLTVLGAAVACDHTLGSTCGDARSGGSGGVRLRGRKRRVAADGAGENCGRGGNGGAVEAADSGGAAAREELCVRTDVALEWLEARAAGLGEKFAERGWGEHAVHAAQWGRMGWVDEAVAGVCDALEIAMRERRALELRFSALQCGLVRAWPTHTGQSSPMHCVHHGCKMREPTPIGVVPATVAAARHLQQLVTSQDSAF